MILYDSFLTPTWHVFGKMASSPLTTLAEKLLEKVKILDAHNERNGLPPASFESESFVDAPLDIEETRRAAIDLSQDIKRLAQGPRDLILESLNLVSDLSLRTS